MRLNVQDITVYPVLTEGQNKKKPTHRNMV